jgi:hypothetical protein
VRAGIGQPVPVRRAAAQVPALLPGLGGHGGADPDPVRVISRLDCSPSASISCSWSSPPPTGPPASGIHS